MRATRLPTSLLLTLAVLCAAVPAVTGCEDTSPTVSIAAAPTSQPGGATQPTRGRISMEDFETLKARPDAVVLDVRSTEEYEEGHVPGAVNIPINADDFDQQVAALDKDKTYLVMCARGGRSKSACKKMEALDLKAMFDFGGGMNAWTAAGKPVQKVAGSAAE